MNIPKKIEILIEQREKLAVKLNHIDCELSDWMESQGIDLYECSDFVRSGCMIYCEPYTAANSVREAIQSFDKQ